MVTATRALNQLKPAKILVIGDFMLDTYTTGDVSRISPEAPVPILHVKKQLHLPGGAGNVAINLQTLGAEVITIGRIGADDHGVELSKLFKQGLFVQKGYQTPGKNRLMSEGQQIIRVDEENNVALSSTIKRKIIKFIHTHCHDVSAIAISDYNKGLLTKSLLGFLIEFGMKNVIPIIVDPKGVDFTPYMGATLIKPNLMEACAASKLPSEATLDQVGESLLAQTKTSMMLITRSSEGMSLFTSDKMRQDFAIKSREVKDVTGAGDTVLAMITLCLANDIEIEEGIYLANIAAGIAVEKVGCHRITLAEVTERILEKDHDSKIFNKTELFSLQRALENKPVILVQMKSKMQLSANLYQNLKKLVPIEDNTCLVLLLLDENPNEQYVSLLSSLQEVGYLLCKFEGLSNLAKTLNPVKIFMEDGDAFIELDQKTALLEDLLNTQENSKKCNSQTKSKNHS